MVISLLFFINMPSCRCFGYIMKALTCVTPTFLWLQCHRSITLIGVGVFTDMFAEFSIFNLFFFQFPVSLFFFLTLAIQPAKYHSSIRRAKLVTCASPHMAHDAIYGYKRNIAIAGHNTGHQLQVNRTLNATILQYTHCCLKMKDEGKCYLRSPCPADVCAISFVTELTRVVYL